MTSRSVVLMSLFALVLSGGCSAREGEEDSRGSPYAGQQMRELKALSPKRMKGYRQGRGMGSAKVAELNRYPGPRHVLDLADQLELTGEQRRKVKKAFRAMEERAREAGRRLVKKEQELDDLFASERAAEAEVEKLIHEIGKLKAEFRYAHVQAHLKVKKTLTSRQIERYDELRGYGKGQEGRRHHSHK